MIVYVVEYEGEFGCSGIVGVYKEEATAQVHAEEHKQEYSHLAPVYYINGHLVE